jgi:ATP-dependent exoDNAse (exonuclease V) beta subunit
VAAKGKFGIGKRHKLDHRIAIVGDVDMASVGHAVHAVLASDKPTFDRAKRVALARDSVARWGVAQIDADHLLAANDALHRFIEREWPGARLHREIPVSARIGEQLVNGRIDLLVEHADGFVVFDHKSFPGARDKLDERAVGFGPQLSLYAEAVTTATGKPVTGMFVHFPIVGDALEIISEL